MNQDGKVVFVKPKSVILNAKIMVPVLFHLQAQALIVIVLEAVALLFLRIIQSQDNPNKSVHPWHLDQIVMLVSVTIAGSFEKITMVFIVSARTGFIIKVGM